MRRGNGGIGLIIIGGIIGWLIGHHDPKPTYKAIGQEPITVVRTEPQVIEMIVEKPVEKIVTVEKIVEKIVEAKGCCDAGCKGAGCDLSKCKCKDCPFRKKADAKKAEEIDDEETPLSAAPPTVKTIERQGQEYGYARAKAVEEKKALVVGVKQDPPALPPAKAWTCRWDAFPGVNKGLVIGIPMGGELWQASVMGPEQDADEVLAEIEAARWRVFAPQPKTITVPNRVFQASFGGGCST